MADSASRGWGDTTNRASRGVGLRNTQQGGIGNSDTQQAGLVGWGGNSQQGAEEDDSEQQEADMWATVGPDEMTTIHTTDDSISNSRTRVINKMPSTAGMSEVRMSAVKVVATVALTFQKTWLS